MSQTDDPFKPFDATTIVRPRPGAGRRAPSETAVQHRHVAPSARRPDAAPSVIDVRSGGINPLVSAATSLLLLMGQLRGTVASPDVAALRRHVLEDMRRFESNARGAGLPNEVVMAARYALCAALDEAVLSTPWGAQSDWAQQTLLVTLHRETWGGEKFFRVLDGLLADPSQHIDLLELQYLCIAFGFNGKYQVRDGGHARLFEIEQQLEALIRSERGAPPPALSAHWEGAGDQRNPLIRYVPWWVVAAAALGIVTIVFTVFYARLGSAAEPVQARLANIGLEAFTVPVDAAPAAPTLKRLLAPEEAQRLLSIEEVDGRTVITPLASDLFASGSATINPAYLPTLDRIAQALSQVPGRVLVKGHTDDQPITSLRYADNFELSRERASGVAKVLQQRLKRGVDSTGVGSTEARYKPPSKQENRSRNRRVEIIHVAGA